MIPEIKQSDQLNSNDLGEHARIEPLTGAFLDKLFQDEAFLRAMNLMRVRLLTSAAEGAIIVYKKLGSDDFVICKRYGLDRADANNFTWRELGASVSIHDDSLDKLSKLGVSESNFVRIGNFHTHPGGNLTFSPGDFDEYEKNTLGAGLDHIKRSYELFEILGCLDRQTNGLSVFGYSLELKGLKTNIYQRDVRSTYEQEELLRESGFRTMRTILKAKGQRLIVSDDNLKQIIQLGQ